MNIPFDIKIFNWIYESGKYLLPLLLVLWLTWLCCTVILRKKKQFLFTSVMFLLFCITSAFFTAWQAIPRTADGLQRRKTDAKQPTNDVSKALATAGYAAETGKP